VPARLLSFLLLTLAATTMASAATPYAGGGMAGSRLTADGPIQAGSAWDLTLGVRAGGWRQEVAFMSLGNTTVGKTRYHLDGYRYLAGYDLGIGQSWGLTLQGGAWFHRSENRGTRRNETATSAVAGAGLFFYPETGLTVRLTANHYPAPAVGETLETAGLQFLFDLP
jgi:opacity protein-like surface antigen